MQFAVQAFIDRIRDSEWYEIKTDALVNHLQFQTTESVTIYINEVDVDVHQLHLQQRIPLGCYQKPLVAHYLYNGQSIEMIQEKQFERSRVL